MRRRLLLPTLLGLALMLGLVLVRLADPYPVRIARDLTFDVFQQLAPRPKASFPVRVIDIDEASLAAIGQWPWPRDLLATLTTRLQQLGAAAIGWDVLFPEADRLSPARIAESPEVWAGLASPPADYDQQFAAALGHAPSILGFAISDSAKTLPLAPKGGTAISGTDPSASIPRMKGAVVPLPQLTAAATGLGALSLEASDSAGVVRALPMLWSDGKRLYPSLPIEMLRVAQGVSTVVVLGDTAGQGYVQSIRVGDFEVPTTASGDLQLYYSRPDPSLYVSARDILGDDWRDMQPLVQNQLVLIGTSASGLLDIHATTLGDNVPGVSIHAQALEQILSQAYLARADWVSGLEIASFIVIGLVMVVFVLRAGPLAALLIGAGLVALVVLGCWVLFVRYHLLLDPSFTVVASFLLYSAMVYFRFAITDADRRQIRRAFGHYVAPTLLAEIERSGEKLKLGGEVRDLTVMFADVRNFTTISEALAPEELLAMLNTLFGALGSEVTGQFGTIDKFIGDSLMAFWNAPVDVEGHARKACLAALGMRQRLGALNAADAFGRRAAGREPGELAIGVGISTGPALVGNMGLETRFDYSCLGDTVNVASRVEGACKTVGYDIVVVEATRAAAADLAFLEAGSLLLKGKSAREPIHILVGNATMAASAAFAALLMTHEAALRDLAQGGDAGIAIGRCREAAIGLEPGLAKFYALLAARAEDFGFKNENAPTVEPRARE